MTTTPRPGSSSDAPRARRHRRPRFALVAVAATCLVGLVATTTAGAAQAPVGLGTATSFAILAGAGITNTGATTITGDVGSFPTTSQTGFGSVTIIGENHEGDAVTQQAKDDLVDAYNDAAGRLPATAVPVELGGSTLTPGVYRSNTALGLTGELTLDAEGDPDAVFVFQAGSTLTTASMSTVTLTGGASACNVYWQIGSSATLGTNSNFVGSVLALESISLTTGADVQGRLLARNGAVTLDTNTITRPDCATITPTPTPTTTAPATTAPATTAPATTSPSARDDTAPTGPGDGDATTPGESPSGPGGPGSPPDGSGTPVGSGPPGAAPPTELAFTGTDPRLAVIGIASLLAGLMCLTLSPVRHRIRT